MTNAAPRKVVTVNAAADDDGEPRENAPASPRNGDLTGIASASLTTSADTRPAAAASTPSPPLPKPRKHISEASGQTANKKDVAGSDGVDDDKVAADDGERDVSFLSYHIWAYVIQCE